MNNRTIYLNPEAVQDRSIIEDKLSIELQNKINSMGSLVKSGITYGGTIDENKNCTLSPRFADSFGMSGTQRFDSITNIGEDKDLSGVYFIASGEFMYGDNMYVKTSDWLVCTKDNYTWEKIDNTDSVTSVNDHTGAVKLTPKDLGLETVLDDIDKLQDQIEDCLTNVEPIPYESGTPLLPGRFYRVSITDVSLLVLAISSTKFSTSGYLIITNDDGTDEVAAKIFWNGVDKITRVFDKYGNDYPYYDPVALPINGSCTNNTVSQECETIYLNNVNNCFIGPKSSDIFMINSENVSIGSNNSCHIIGIKESSNLHIDTTNRIDLSGIFESENKGMDYLKERLANLKDEGGNVENVTIGNSCSHITVSAHCKNVSIGNGCNRIYIPGKHNAEYTHDVTIGNGVIYINYDCRNNLDTLYKYLYYPMQHVTIKDGTSSLCFKNAELKTSSVDLTMRNYVVDYTANIYSAQNWTDTLYKTPSIISNSEYVRWITNSKIAGVIDWVPSDLYSLINEGKDLTVKIRGWIIPSQGSDQIAGFNNSEITASLNGVSSREIYLTIGTDGKSAYNDVNISYYNYEQIFASVKSELSNITFPAGAYVSGSVTKYDIVWSNTEFSGSMEYNSLNDFELGVSTESRPDLTSENSVDLTKLVYVDVFLGVDVEIEGGNSGDDL